MISSELLIELEPDLKAVVRHYYPRINSFAQYGHFAGDAALQAARIALVLLAEEDTEAIAILRHRPHELVEIIRAELNEPERRLAYTPSLHRRNGDSHSSEWIEAFADPSSFGTLRWADRRRLITDPDEVRESLEVIAGMSSNELREELRVIREQMKTASRREAVNLGRAYYATLAETYERVRAGDIEWADLRSHHASFFNDAVNGRGIIRYVTETYILPKCDCSLEDIPVQNGLRTVLKDLRVYNQYKFRTHKDFFCFGYPEMEKSSHWHPARWYKLDIPPGKEMEYWRFRRQYLFEHRLGCRTKEDVIATLNDWRRMGEVASLENMWGVIFHSDGRYHLHPYSLIADLGDNMYDIDPWEISSELPRNVFRQQNGETDEAKVGIYLLWVDGVYGFPVQSPVGANFHPEIPHYVHLVRDLKLTSSDIKRIYLEAKRQTQQEERTPTTLKLAG